MSDHVAQNGRGLSAASFPMFGPEETFPTDGELTRAIDGARELANILSTTPAGKLVVSVGTVRWEVERREAVVTTAPEPRTLEAAPAPAPAPVTTDQVIAAPLVGVFYPAPGPGRSPFVSVGDRVTAGQQVAIVEAMKMMNEVTASCAGTITRVHIGEGDIVEHGQALFTVQPD